MPVLVTFFGDEGMITVDDPDPDHDAAYWKARSDRYEKALREIVGSLVEDDCWCHDEGMSGDACVPCIARAALAEDES